MVCSETDFKSPLASARGSVFMPDRVTAAKYQKPCGIGREARASSVLCQTMAQMRSIT